MAWIVKANYAPDGYDVLVRLNTGQDWLFHFTHEPADMQAAVNLAEAEHLASLPTVEPDPSEVP